jgi:hypothetical protein
MKVSQRTSLKLLCGALFISAVCYGAADPETLFNGNYQIELREGGHVSTAKSQFLLKAGEKAKARMEPTDVEMWIQPVSDVEYDFHIVVLVAPNKTPPNQARIDKVYRGRFGLPLELVMSERDLKVKGSVAVIRYRPRA